MNEETSLPIHQQVENRLACLIGQPLISFFRMVDMEMIDFGTPHQTRIEAGPRRGELTTIYQYSLHVQSAWRLIKNNRIVMGDFDLATRLKWELPQIAKGDEERRLIDWRIEQFNKTLSGRLSVQRIHVTSLFDLHLEFTDNYLLELLPMKSTASDESEHWRFIDSPKGYKNFHLVVSGAGAHFDPGKDK